MIPQAINAGETGIRDTHRRVRVDIGVTSWLVTTDGHAMVAAHGDDASFPAAPDGMFPKADPKRDVLARSKPPKSAFRTTVAHLVRVFGPPVRPAGPIPCPSCGGKGSYPHGRCVGCSSTLIACTKCDSDGNLRNEPEPRRVRAFERVFNANLVACALAALPLPEREKCDVWLDGDLLSVFGTDWRVLVMRMNWSEPEKLPVVLEAHASVEASP